MVNKPISSFQQLTSGLVVFDCLCQLDQAFFTTYGRELFRNVDDLNQTMFNSAATNNWGIIQKAFQAFLQRDNYQEAYLELNIDLIVKGDKNELFGFFIAFISVVLIKKKYLWNQSIGLVSNSDSYNYLKELEENVIGGETDESKNKKPVTSEKDDSQTLVDMITDLQKNLKAEIEKSSQFKQAFDSKKDEADEIRKMLDQKSFDLEKMKMRMEALELSQKEYYDAIAMQNDHTKLLDTVKKLEKREEELEIENSFLRDKVAEQDKRIKDLKEIEAKYSIEESMRKKFDMILERNEILNSDLRKKELEIEGLKYQVEILRKSKEAIEVALTNARAENMKLDQQIINLNEELKAKEQEINNLDKIIIKLKEQLDLNMMNSQPMQSPMVRKRGTLDLDFKKPEEEEYIMQLESEIEKLRAEKELGWVDSEANNKSLIDKEVLNQEIARLNEKIKRVTNQLEDYKKKEEDWNQRESKYQTTCKNFKKTIAELKKELDAIKGNQAANKNFEALFADSQKLKKEYEEEVKILYSLISDLDLENQALREDRGRKRNFMVDFLDSGMKLFEEVA